MIFFVQLLKFVDSNEEAQVNKMIKTARTKFVETLEEKKKAMKNFMRAESIALGCLAQCFFCGARCMQH